MAYPWDGRNKFRLDRLKQNNNNTETKTFPPSNLTGSNNAMLTLNGVREIPSFLFIQMGSPQQMSKDLGSQVLRIFQPTVDPNLRSQKQPLQNQSLGFLDAYACSRNRLSKLSQCYLIIIKFLVKTFLKNMSSESILTRKVTCYQELAAPCRPLELPKRIQHKKKHSTPEGRREEKKQRMQCPRKIRYEVKHDFTWRYC